MPLRITQWTLDVQDVNAMARFWSAALDYRIKPNQDGTAHLLPPEGAAAAELTIWLQHSAGPKSEKSRNHPDLEPVEGTAQAEVERLIALGARRVDVGQTGQEPFTVLADPEGNEFCVLHRR